MTFEEFTLKYNNKPIDFDNSFGYQCVDLYRQYVKEVLNYPQSPAVIGASDIWTTYLKEYYERIDNEPTNIPQKGDVVIWDDIVGGGLGHVAIFDHGNVNAFVSFDQNWPVGSFCHFQSHNYDNLLGWLRPKSFISIPDGLTDDERRTLEHLKFSFNALPEGDKYKLGNLEGYARGMTYEHLQKPKTREPYFPNSFAKSLYELAKAIQARFG